MTPAEKKTILHKIARCYYNEKKQMRSYSIKQLLKSVNETAKSNISWPTMYNAVVNGVASPATVEIIQKYLIKQGILN